MSICFIITKYLQAEPFVPSFQHIHFLFFFVFLRNFIRDYRTECMENASISRQVERVNRGHFFYISLKMFYSHSHFFSDTFEMMESFFLDLLLDKHSKFQDFSSTFLSSFIRGADFDFKASSSIFDIINWL